MDILPLHFRTLSYSGLWTDNSNSSLIKSFYKLLVISLIFHFTISEAAGFIKTCASEEDSTQGLFLSFTFVALCLKICNFTFQRGKMSEIIKDFQIENFQPTSREETVIWEKYNKKARRIFLIIMILSQSSGLCFLALPFVETGFGNSSLPFKTYQPYDVASSQVFWFTYVLQLFAAFYGVLINVSMDTMVYGFILLLCAQYEILSLRLVKIDGNENFLLKSYVDHHVHIKNQSKIILNAIYNSNWTQLNSKNKRSLRFIMQFSAKGVVISHHGQCVLNLNTFVWIMKTSYSALSVLRNE
ncbi:odorant receptor 94a-like [Leptopilina heterotoma]|uniref:odorant receptor 94a-like n=1 Tax=Leptopilina heterotoma TaxID=63436 RepID=UPI001CA8F281|nr:odorant receptor 94a-like [Leptopilina heterotoma]